MSGALLAGLLVVFVVVMAITARDTSRHTAPRHGRHRHHLRHTGRIQHLIARRSSMTARSFHIGEILTAATGTYLCTNGLAGFEALVRHVTGEVHLSHQLGRAGEDIAPHIREQFPWIAEITVPPIADESAGLAFLATVVAQYGEYHQVKSMPLGMYVGREPIAEFREMAPNVPIIAVEVPGGDTAAEVIHLRYAQVHATLAGPAGIDPSWRDLLAAARNVLEHADAGVFTGSAAVPWQYLSALSECAGRATEAGQ